MILQRSIGVTILVFGLYLFLTVENSIIWAGILIVLGTGILNGANHAAWFSWESDGEGGCDGGGD